MMRQQSQIQRTLGGAEGIARITTLLERERFSSRSDLGRRVCEEFDFRDRLGRLQLSGCLNALRVIEQRCDSIVLPVAGTAVPRAGRPSLLAEGVPEHLGQVRRLRILGVGGPRQRRVWNTLIAHHPCGMTTFAGAQMRYLVDSEHGWLAAVGFSAAALRLAAREQWIGWSDRQRRAHLDKPQGDKSRRWIDGYRDIAQAAGKLTRGTRVIAVMDREADFWGLFDEQRRRGRVEILVRAKHNRRLRKGPDGKLFAQLGGGPADGYMNVEVAGLTGRPKSSRKQARAARLRRRAGCELRYRKVVLPATQAGGEPAVLRGVHVVETDPPQGEKGLQWHLLTSLPVRNCTEPHYFGSRALFFLGLLGRPTGWKSE